MSAELLPIEHQRRPRSRRPGQYDHVPYAKSLENWLRITQPAKQKLSDYADYRAVVVDPASGTRVVKRLVALIQNHQDAWEPRFSGDHVALGLTFEPTKYRPYAIGAQILQKEGSLTAVSLSAEHYDAQMRARGFSVELALGYGLDSAVEKLGRRPERQFEAIHGSRPDQLQGVLRAVQVTVQALVEAV